MPTRVNNARGRAGALVSARGVPYRRLPPPARPVRHRIAGSPRPIDGPGLPRTLPARSTLAVGAPERCAAEPGADRPQWRETDHADAARGVVAMAPTGPHLVLAESRDLFETAGDVGTATTAAPRVVRPENAPAR